MEKNSFSLKSNLNDSKQNEEIISSHYPINININISSNKKEGDIFQRNSASTSTKTTNKRIYNINNKSKYNFKMKKLILLTI